MKHMKKLLSLVLTLVTVFALSATAMADETYTITINGAADGTGATPGYTYEAYQVFAGDLAEKDGHKILSNITWGTGVNGDNLLAALKADTTMGIDFTAVTSAADVAEQLTGKEEAVATAFAKIVAKHLAEKSGTGTTEIKVSAPGYYFIKNTTVPESVDTAFSNYMLQVVANVTVNHKGDVPEVSKKIVDGDSWVDYTDANIGDDITFHLIGALPTKYADYTTYKYIFHDTLSAGLTRNNDVKVYLATIEKTDGEVTKVTKGNDITNHFVASGVDNTGTFTVTCDDLKQVTTDASAVIVVEYTAKLNEKAVIKGEGNPNDVYLEYSNNPNADGTGKTPEDEVKVYTWEIPVFKYTGTDTPLAGAGFTLYDGKTAVKLTKADGEGNIYKVDPNGSITEIVTDSTGKFEIEGLDQGSYVLKETTTPAGYNTVGDITVTIGADGTLTVNQTTVTEVKVLNQSGTLLPETGGIGTTIFYVLGGVMMAGAVVLMVTKRRMNAER